MGITTGKRRSGDASTAEAVRSRIESGGERVWRLADFDGLPFTAVAQTLSRLARQGAIQRLGKGLYFRPRPTAFGPSRPNTALIRGLPIRERKSFPRAWPRPISWASPPRIPAASSWRPTDSACRV